ncbi:MAG: response regulator [Candidatus Magasanikbacteria bacterium]|nr:response regulator [Candidatus Magasanikbacteria bacterium]
MKILLVDDNNRFRGILREILKLKDDITVIEAISGHEALEILKEEKVNLIISDYLMVGMNGMKLLQKIRSNPEHQNIPFIMATGYPEDDLISEIQSAGATFLQKPFLKETLFETIEKSTTKN